MSRLAPVGDAEGSVGAIQPTLENIGRPGARAMVGQCALHCHIATWGKLETVAEKTVLTHCALCPQGACLAREEQVELGGECAAAKVNTQASILDGNHGRSTRGV